MKTIKIIISLLFVALLFVHCDKEIEGEKWYSGDAFVRFNLIVNKSNQVVEAGDNMPSNIAPSETFIHSNIKPIKVPVVLTSAKLNSAVEVKYSVDTNLPDIYTISPANTLTFDSDNCTDTIEITFSDRWTEEDGFYINLSLDEISDNSIHIGQLNDSIVNKRLDISLGTINSTCSFSTNRIEIKGNEGEQIEFKLHFDNGFIPQEVSELALFSEQPGFNYSLEQVIDENDIESIKYILTLNEAITKDDVNYSSTFTLNSGTAYEAVGNTILQIVKPIKVDRDVNTNPAGYFYDLSDPYFRTYGENWIYNSSDEVCKWQAWNAYSYPVLVNKDDDGARRYSGENTEDESDDIYYHAFRIHFNSNIEGKTTNSFNLKRWFNNESGSSAISPGLNISNAIEFYPKDGTSTTEGTVLVIPQTITIGNTDGVTHNISISGEGTYQLIKDGLIEISLTFVATNNELFGGSRVSYYKLYNNNSYGGDPDDIAADCIQAIDL